MLVVSGAAAVAVFVLAGPLAELIADERVDDIATVLRILAPTIPAWSLTNALLGATRGLGTINPTVDHPADGQTADSDDRPRHPGRCWTGWNRFAISVAWGAPVVLAAGATVVATARLGGLSDLGPSAVTAGEFWSYARPRAISTGLQIAHERVDILIVGAMLGTGLAGVYGGLSRFATAGNFIAFALTQAVSPNLRKAITAGDRRRRSSAVPLGFGLDGAHLVALLCSSSQRSSFPSPSCSTSPIEPTPACCRSSSSA